MDRKTDLNPVLVLILFIILALIFYYPVLLGKIPINSNLLVSFWYPWRSETWEGFPTGVPFKFLGVDEVREFFPLLDFTYDSLREGTIPLWNPYNFSGYPHLANWASAVFYPLNLAIFLLDKIQVFIFLKLSAIVLSGLFTYLYLCVLAIDKRAALFGAAAFSFSAPMLIWGAEIWQSVHSFLWLPLILFAIEKIIRTKKIPYLVLLAFASASSIMGGYIQPTIYLGIVSTLYVLFRILSLSPRSILMIISGFAFGLFFSAIHALPGIEAFLLAPRKDIALIDVNLGFLIPPSSGITFFVPDVFGHIATANWFLRFPGQYYEQLIYIGVVPLVLSFFSLFKRQVRAYFLFFLLLTLASLSLTIDLPTSRLIYKLGIPFLSTAIPIRVILVVAFSLSVLSSFGLSWWLKSETVEKKKFILSLLPITLIYTSIGAWLFGSFSHELRIADFPPNWYIVSLRNFFIPAAVFVSLIFILLGGAFIARARSSLYLLIVALMLFHSFQFAHKYFVFSDRHIFYPQTPLFEFLKNNLGTSRYWGYADATLVNNFATVYKLYSPDGYDPVNIRYYNELLSSSNQGKFEGVSSRSDAVIPNDDVHPFEDKNHSRLRIFDLLGIRLIGYLEKDKEGRAMEEKHPRFELLWERDGFYIYENKMALDRAFLVPEAVYIKDKEEASAKIYDPTFDISKKVVLSDEVSLDKNNVVDQGSAKIVYYSPNKVIIQAETDSPQFLVLSDAYFPGWKARVDGADTKIYQAFHALRAIVLPKGAHEVVFLFEPLSFRIGFIATLLSILLATGLLALYKIQWKKRR